MDGINDAMDLKVSKLQGHSEGQGHLECCSSWGCKELDMTDKNSIRQSELKAIIFILLTTVKGFNLIIPKDFQAGS